MLVTTVLWVRVKKEVVSIEIFNLEMILNINLRTWKSSMVLHTDILFVCKGQSMNVYDNNRKYRNLHNIFFSKSVCHNRTCSTCNQHVFLRMVVEVIVLWFWKLSVFEHLFVRVMF